MFLVPLRLATHLSLPADRGFFLIDGSFGDHWFVGTADTSTGEFRLIREFVEYHNHGQFSPVDLRTFPMDIEGTWYTGINPEHHRPTVALTPDSGIFQ